MIKEAVILLMKERRLLKKRKSTASNKEAHRKIKSADEKTVRDGLRDAANNYTKLND